MAKPVPDRWEDYTPIGARIEGTRFIAFKVPLREHVSATVERTKRLDGKTLLRTIPNLGLIIDLTNTYRYYNPIFFRDNGIEHVKIMVPGKMTPPEELMKQFIRTVKCFLSSNKDNDKLIGVHCTHGVNRTGYFICNYMISQLFVKPNVAIDKFGKARGYQIERTNYIEDLQKLKFVNQQNCRERKSRSKTHQNRNRNDIQRERSSSNFRPKNNAERYIDQHSSMSGCPPGLSLDYYNTSPRDNAKHIRLT